MFRMTFNHILDSSTTLGMTLIVMFHNRFALRMEHLLELIFDSDLREPDL